MYQEIDHLVRKIKATKLIVKEQYHAISYLCGLNGVRHQEILDTLANQFLNDENKYPKNLASAHKISTKWRGTEGPKQSNTCSNDGAAFTSSGATEHGTNFTIYPNQVGVAHTTIEGVKIKADGTPVRCFKCNGNHYCNKYLIIKKKNRQLQKLLQQTLKKKVST